MTLATYRKKRNFKETLEPEGRQVGTDGRRFVVQEHHASQLHFDFRLEMGGVLKSWAVPKGPSLDPREKRLAVQVEDHPVDYADFEGEIKEGNYGAGHVKIWDHGQYELLDEGDPIEQYQDGKLSFILHGEKLRGQFNLVKMQNRSKQWLLIKSNDEFAISGWKLTTLLDENGKANKRRPTRLPSRSKNRNKNDEEGIKAAGSFRKAKPKATLEFEHGGTRITIPDLERAPMLHSLEPMLATLVDKPFDDPDWFFEYKWDGVRALAYLSSGKAHLMSRHDKEMGFRYPELGKLAETVAAKQAILDGEIVALDDQGKPNFQLLQSRIGLEAKQDIKHLAHAHPVVYYVFDLLYFNGFNLMTAPLAERKDLLEVILTPSDRVQLSPHILQNGKALFEKVQAANMEGIIAKHLGSTYVQRRSSRWLKVKTVLQQEVVIGGYTEPRGTREFFGALVAGLYRDDYLVFVGHVGGGFNRRTLAQLFKLMRPLKTKRSPFAVTPPTNEPVQWIKPSLVAEVKFAGWTADAQMRQPIFMGMRDDKDPKECVFEESRSTEDQIKKAERKVAGRTSGKNKSLRPPARVISLEELLADEELEGDVQVKIDNTLVSLTHLHKPYWPEEGLSKGDLLRYYARVSPHLLPYLAGRPLILKRYPNGIDAPFFFQHDLENAPDFVRVETLEVESGRQIDYAVIDNLATLLYLTNLGTIEQHPWISRIENLDHPDWMVFDLDPSGEDLAEVCRVALALREFLEDLELPSYPKTSGSRGIHVFVPLEPKYTYELVAQLAELIAVALANEHPNWATVERSLERRKSGLVYVDYLQNARGKSIAAPYSARARRGATVSTPLNWQEVKGKIKTSDFTILTLQARLKKKGDLFKQVLTDKSSIKKAIEQLDRMNKPNVQVAR